MDPVYVDPVYVESAKRMIEEEEKRRSKVTMNSAIHNVDSMFFKDPEFTQLVLSSKCSGVWQDERRVEFMKNAFKTLCNSGKGIGDVDDCYHSFNELYHHRTVMFAIIVNNLFGSIAWKSKKHHDDAEPIFDGMFIVGVTTPIGQATYHCDLPYWDMFHVKELERAPEFDGHTPEDALNRLWRISCNDPMVNPYNTKEEN